MKRFPGVISIPAILLAAVTAWAEPELKGSPEELRQFLHPIEHTVTLTGQHEETAYTDKANVSLVIRTERDALAVAIAANAETRGQVTTRLLDAGVPAEAIRSSKFSTSPQFGWFGNRPRSFEVVNRMTVGITDEAHLELLATLIDANDEISLDGMTFEHTTKKQAEAAVRQAALDDAIAQKQKYESALGIELLPVNFSEQPMYPQARSGAGARIEEIVVTGQRLSDRATPSAPMPPPTFDEIRYAAVVYVTFQVVRQ